MSLTLSVEILANFIRNYLETASKVLHSDG